MMSEITKFLRDRSDELRKLAALQISGPSPTIYARNLGADSPLNMIEGDVLVLRVPDRSEWVLPEGLAVLSSTIQARESVVRLECIVDIVHLTRASFLPEAEFNEYREQVIEWAEARAETIAAIRGRRRELS